MTKDEFRGYLKAKMKELGFKNKNSFWYKYIDETYAICFDIDHSSYAREYTCALGGQFLYPGEQVNCGGRMDCCYIFCFPQNPGDSIDFSLCDFSTNEYVRSYYKNSYKPRFEYPDFTIEQLDEYFDANYAQFAPTFLDKNKFLETLCSNYFHFRTYTPEKLLLVCNMCNLDKKEVYDFAKKQGFGKKCRNGIITEPNWELLLE